METKKVQDSENVLEDQSDGMSNLLLVGLLVFFLAGYQWPLLMLVSCTCAWLLMARSLKKEGLSFLVRHIGGGLAFLAVVVLAVFAGPSTKTTETDAALQACVDRGIRYYKDIGSYPILLAEPNRGKRADEVARSRCTSSPRAF